MNEGLLAKREGWEEQAKCKDLNPDLFFNRNNEDSARMICDSCGVKEQCLEFALEHNILYGIWGGMNEEERKRLRRKMHRRMSA